MPERDAPWLPLVRNLTAELSAAPDGSHAADAARIWLRVVNKFSPLLGAASVLVLLDRSVRAQVGFFPFLAPVEVGTPIECIESLEKQYEHAARQDVFAANNAIMQHFAGLLAGLIGDGLTARFFRAIVLPRDTDRPAQEINE